MQKDGSIKVGKMLFGDGENLLPFLGKVRDECASLSEPDRCEMAFKRMTCAKGVAEKNGIVVPLEMI